MIYCLWLVRIEKTEKEGEKETLGKIIQTGPIEVLYVYKRREIDRDW